MSEEAIPLWARVGPRGHCWPGGTRRSRVCSGDSEQPPSTSAFPPAGSSPAVREGQLQLGLGQLELLLPDGVGQHLPVRVVGVGLRSQLKELPDGHSQGPVGVTAIRGPVWPATAQRMWSRSRGCQGAAPVITPVSGDNPAKDSAFLQETGRTCHLARPKPVPRPPRQIKARLASHEASPCVCSFISSPCQSPDMARCRSSWSCQAPAEAAGKDAPGLREGRCWGGGVKLGRAEAWGGGRLGEGGHTGGQGEAGAGAGRGHPASMNELGEQAGRPVHAGLGEGNRVVASRAPGSPGCPGGLGAEGPESIWQQRSHSGLSEPPRAASVQQGASARWGDEGGELGCLPRGTVTSSGGPVGPRQGAGTWSQA